LSTLRRDYDLRSAMQWREHVVQTRSKVSTIIANKMQVRYDWFEVSEEMTVGEVCRRKAINLVRQSILIRKIKTQNICRY